MSMSTHESEYEEDFEDEQSLVEAAPSMEAEDYSRFVPKTREFGDPFAVGPAGKEYEKKPARIEHEVVSTRSHRSSRGSVGSPSAGSSSYHVTTSARTTHEPGGVVTTTYTVTREDIIPRDAEEQASPREMELIERLKNSNAKLRAKLETARSSLTKMKAQRAVTGRARDPYAERRQVKALLDDKERQARGLKRKIETAKRTFSELKKQASEAFQADKIELLENMLKDKKTLLSQLQVEKKELETEQRQLINKIKEQEKMKKKYPELIQSLQSDLKVAKERIRKSTESELAIQEKMRKQHEHMASLLEKNRNLKEELEEYELKTGQRDAENQIREEMRAWAEEKEQLLEDIRRLEEEHGTDLSRADLASQSAEQRIKRLKSEIAELHEVVYDREKSIQLQQVAINRMKRLLREAALETPRDGAPTPRTNTGRHSPLDIEKSPVRVSSEDIKRPAHSPVLPTRDGEAKTNEDEGNGSGDGALPSAHATPRKTRAEVGRNSARPTASPVERPSPRKSEVKVNPSSARMTAAEKKEEEEDDASDQEEYLDDSFVDEAALDMSGRQRKQSSTPSPREDVSDEEEKYEESFE